MSRGTAFKNLWQIMNYHFGWFKTFLCVFVSLNFKNIFTKIMCLSLVFRIFLGKGREGSKLEKKLRVTAY